MILNSILLKSQVIFYFLKNFNVHKPPWKNLRKREKIGNIWILKWENVENTLEECPVKYSV